MKSFASVHVLALLLVASSTALASPDAGSLAEADAVVADAAASLTDAATAADILADVGPSADVSVSSDTLAAPDITAAVERATTIALRLADPRTGPIDPAELFDQAGLPPSLFDGPEGHKLARLLAQASGKPGALTNVAEARETLTQLVTAWLALSEQERTHRLSADRGSAGAPVAARGAAGTPAKVQEPAPKTTKAPVVSKQTSAQADEKAAAAADAANRALAAAQRATSEKRAAIERERARLLEVQEAQARFRADLIRADEAAAARKTKIETWAKEVEGLRTGERLGEPVAERSDDLFDALAPELREARAQLEQALDALDATTNEAFAGTVPGPGKAPELAGSADELATLRTLRGELLNERTELVSLTASARFDAAEDRKSELDTASIVRLSLLSLMSDERASTITGFGAEGMRQVRDEVGQVALGVRHRLRTAPRSLGQVFSDAVTSPVPLIMLVLKIIALTLVFLWWRRRADETLKRLRSGFLKVSPPTIGSRFASSMLWYVSRIRAPVEHLIYWGLIIDMVAKATHLHELGFVWVVLKWIFWGQIVIRLLDAVAARPRRDSADPLSELRFRSLRLVGLTIVAVGLLLTLTATSVGEGALYHWVLKTCWLLAIPIVLVLVKWWTPVIYQRIENRGDLHGVLDWASNNRDGFVGLVSRVAAAAFLFFESIYQRLFRQLTNFEGPRQALAFFARREVEKQANQGDDDQQLVPLGSVMKRRLGPLTSPPEVLPIAPAERKELFEYIREDDYSLTAVVGERGLGKSVFVSSVIDKLRDRDVVEVICPPGTFADVISVFAKTLELADGADEAAVVSAMTARKPRLIVVEDIHRIIRPVIGGIDQLDRLLAFARAVGGHTSWVLTLQSPSWQHVRRVRGDLAVFDQVITLPPWSEESIRTLMESRAASCQLAPSFANLRLPRQLDVDSSLPLAERNEHSFFRFAWSYSAGNPAVALHIWSNSIKQNRDGKAVVSLHDAASPNDLEHLEETMPYILRAVIRHEVATEAEIVASTRLSPEDVANAIRLGLSREYLEYDGDRLAVTWEWYRAVSTMLRRRNLLVT